MDLAECYRKGFIRRTAVNIPLIQSLVEMANNKEFTVQTAQINERTISAYVSLAYDALREILEAICIMHGYKVTSHVCTEQLLEKFVPAFDAIEFDRLRYTRNSINYYGKNVEYEQGKEIIKKIFKMKQQLLEEQITLFLKKGLYKKSSNKQGKEPSK